MCTSLVHTPLQLFTAVLAMRCKLRPFMMKLALLPTEMRQLLPCLFVTQCITKTGTAINRLCCMSSNRSKTKQCLLDDKSCTISKGVYTETRQIWSPGNHSGFHRHWQCQRGYTFSYSTLCRPSLKAVFSTSCTSCNQLHNT